MIESQPHDVDEQETGEPVLGIAVWGVIVAVSLIYLAAFPIRIQFWVTRTINNQLYNVEDRKWMPVRDVWWTFIRDAPTLGTQLLVQILIVVSALGTLVASLWLVRIILTDDGATSADA